FSDGRSLRCPPKAAVEEVKALTWPANSQTQHLGRKASPSPVLGLATGANDAPDIELDSSQSFPHPGQIISSFAFSTIEIGRRHVVPELTTDHSRRRYCSCWSGNRDKSMSRRVHRQR